MVVKLTEEEIKKLDLELTIQAYATVLTELDDGATRIMPHDHLCTLLGVTRTEFSPFSGFDLLPHTFEAPIYEKWLRLDIARLKSKTSQSTRSTKLGADKA